MANGRNCGDLLKQIHDELEKQANNLLRAPGSDDGTGWRTAGIKSDK